MTDNLNSTQQPNLSERDAELLSAYIDDMLADEARIALEERLENDAFLKQELAAMRQTVVWINELSLYKAPRDFTITLADVQQPDTRTKSNIIPLQNRNGWWLASAAAILIVIIGAVAIVPQFLRTSAPEAAGDIALASTPLPTQAAELDNAEVVEEESFPETSADSRLSVATSQALPTTAPNTANNSAMAIQPTTTAETLTFSAATPTTDSDADIAGSGLAQDEATTNDIATFSTTAETTELENEAANGADDADDAASSSLADSQTAPSEPENNAAADSTMAETTIVEPNALPLNYLVRIFLTVLENVLEVIQP